MADARDDLAKYNAKRHFDKTAEPAGKVKKSKSGFSYLIQKHAATRLHYDFRLELDGVLKSWAVTRGPSLDPHDRRLAVEVEDHPVDYGSFEGTIPKGEYGGGTVMLWDRGTWEPIGDPHEGLRKGDLKFMLHGERLHGSWALVRMKPRPQDRGRNNWLLIKHTDEAAHEGDADALLEDNAFSVVSGRTMDEIATGDSKVWHSDHAEEKPAAKKTKKPAAEPALSFIEPELATLADAIPQGGNWVHEVKFDGYRTLAMIEDGAVRLMTRKGLDWTHKFHTVGRLLEDFPAKNAILDGEIVVLNDRNVSSFASLQKALSDGDAGRLQYYVFDLLWLDGEDWRGKPLVERKAKLAELMKGHAFEDRVIYSEHFTEGAEKFLTQLCRLDMEGVISKPAGSAYVSGRAGQWLKVKCHKRQEFIIGGFTESEAEGRGFRSLLLGYYEDEKLVYAGKVGTGFNSDMMIDIRRKMDGLVTKERAFDKVTPDARRAVWLKPELVCEIEFTEWTTDGRLRHPSFQGLREDKPAADVGRDRPVHMEAVEKAVTKEVETPKPVKKAPAKKNGRVEVSGISISHPDRVIYPGTEITKLDLAEYYYAVAETMLPYVANRPLSMVRCPEGIGEECFFQRHIAREQSPHLYDTGIQVKGRHEDYLMIKDVEGLITLVQWGVIEMHPWGCHADKPDRPDQMIFDLDPDPEVPFSAVIAGVLEVKQRMEEFGLRCFLKTTGGKGLHVVIPIEREFGWPAIKALTRAVAESMEHDSPDRYISKASKAARKGLIFVDYLRNDLTSTAVAPYAVRARPGATVATPIHWEELNAKLKPADFNIETVPQRLKTQKDDPWAEFLTVKQAIPKAILDALKIKAE